MNDDIRLETERLDKEEDNLVEEIKEWLLNNERIHGHIIARIQTYVKEPYGIDLLEPQTEIQQELVCQWQVVLMNKLLARVMIS